MDTAWAELKSQISGTEAPSMSPHGVHRERVVREDSENTAQCPCMGPCPSSTHSHGAANILLTLLTHYQISMEHWGILTHSLALFSTKCHSSVIGPVHHHTSVHQGIEATFCLEVPLCRSVTIHDFTQKSCTEPYCLV